MTCISLARHMRQLEKLKDDIYRQVIYLKNKEM